MEGGSMIYLCDGDEFSFKGMTFKVKFDYDDCGEAPWDHCDGHGKVRVVSKPHWHRENVKRPGERPMNKPTHHEVQYLYDWEGAAKAAREDGWNTEPHDAPHRIQRSVQADFDFLSGWVNNEWHYMLVTVYLLDNDGNVVDESTVGGVESYKDYHCEFAFELAEDLCSAAITAQEKANLESIERLHWAERDVATV
jgi:hypothetical protein